MQSDTATNRVSCERIVYAYMRSLRERMNKAFEIVVGGERHTFDSFEWQSTRWRLFARTAIAGLVGHGVEANGQIFCCVHGARAFGTTQLKDRVQTLQQLQ